jgi:ABC-type transport system substrate-binding protein
VAVLGLYDTELVRSFAAPDPDVLWHWFVNDTVSPAGPSLNLTRLRDDGITAGFDAGRSAPDAAGRARAYAGMQAAMAAQLPVLWLHREQWRIATGPRVRNARNVTLPDGTPATPYQAGAHRLAETWIDR